MSEISIRLLVDKAQQRVVFAESGSNFIDILFSFLTLPLGRIVRLLGKQSGLRSLDSLYESVEQLDAKHVQTETCKKDATEEEGGFVKDKSDFIITDDLRVMPISLMTGFSLLKDQKYEDASALEEWVVDVDSEKALNLLRRSLISKRALTEVFFPDTCIAPTVKCSSAIKEEIDGREAEEEEQFNVKIILNKMKNLVLYAEVGEDFADQLLSFLTFPFGSVFRLLDDRISLEGCINNLSSSAETLSTKHFKSEKCKNMVVFPQLASYYGCRNKILKLDEMNSKKMTCLGSCVKCFWDNSPKISTTVLINSKKMKERIQ